MNASFSALVIDDDSFARRTAVTALRRIGAMHIVEAASGVQALHEIKTSGTEFDVVLCDLRMPEVDGLEVLRCLASRTSSAIVILISAIDKRVLRSASSVASEFGLSGVVGMSKPVTISGLHQAINEAEAKLLSRASLFVSTPDILFTHDDIRTGLENKDFIVFYQPKVLIKNRSVKGVEALVRWQHPEYGLLTPGAFLSLAQQTNLMGAMTDYVFTMAVAQCAAWRAAGHKLCVSVNLSLTGLIDSDLPQRLAEIAERYSLLPEYITIEIVEDFWLQGSTDARELLTRLRLRGFYLSLDDYGTGFATMQQLLQAPFHEMKIDKSFIGVANTETDQHKAMISSISLAHQLGMVVVAEGAESQLHWDRLAEAGCDQVQGNFISPALPAEQIVPWMAAWEQNYSDDPAWLLEKCKSSCPYTQPTE